MTADEMWEELQRRWVPDDWFQPTEEYRLQYQSKFRVAEKLKPRVIAEIGARAGYSGFAMLSGAGPEARYIGFEHNVGNYGGVVGISEHLPRVLAGWEHEVRYADSQQLTRIEDPIDLFHVDGDHSWDGTWHDCEIAFASSAWVMVDDYDYMRPVQAAVDHFIITHAIPVFQHVHDGGFRGSMVFAGARHPIMAPRISKGAA